MSGAEKEAATGPHALASQFIHLGLGSTSIPQPEFGGLEWYEGYGQRHGSDGAEGRLVAWYDFDADWDVWEMHPKGTEVVLCVAGSMTLHQEQPDGSVETVTLGKGEYAINPPGIWHTADVHGAEEGGSATAVFITAGEGTEHRPR